MVKIFSSEHASKEAALQQIEDSINTWQTSKQPEREFVVLHWGNVTVLELANKNLFCVVAVEYNTVVHIMETLPDYTFQ